MEVSNDYTELNARLATAGWKLLSVKQKGNSYVATAQNANGITAQSADSIRIRFTDRRRPLSSANTRLSTASRLHALVTQYTGRATN